MQVHQCARKHLQCKREISRLQWPHSQSFVVGDASIHHVNTVRLAIRAEQAVNTIRHVLPWLWSVARLVDILSVRAGHTIATVRPYEGLLQGKSYSVISRRQRLAS